MGKKTKNKKKTNTNFQELKVLLVIILDKTCKIMEFQMDHPGNDSTRKVLSVGRLEIEKMFKCSIFSSGY